MNFLNPFFLIGLLAIAIPVVLHLINLRRPQKVSFSTLSFFNELKKSTIRRIRIKQYVLMALRIAALLLLALALARPFLPPALTGGASASSEPKAIGILIDNSPSMSRIGSQGPLIDQAKTVAKTIIQESRPNDRFIIGYTNGTDKGFSLEGHTAALEQVEKAESANMGNYTAGTLRMMHKELVQASMKQAVIYLVTDGQASQLADLSSAGEEQTPGKQSVALQMIKLTSANQQNLAVSSLGLKSSMLSKGTPLTLSVEVKNTGETPADNQFVSLEVEGHMAGQYEVSLKPGESKEFLFEIIPDKAGDLSGKVILEGDEVAYDNNRFFVIRIPSSRAVLLIHDSKRQKNAEFDSYLKPALEASQLTNTQIELTDKAVDETNPAEWGTYDVIILNSLKEVPEYWFQELQRYVQNGNGLFFFPSEQGDVSNYNAFFQIFNAGSFNGIKGAYASFDPVEQMGNLVEGHPILDELFDKKKDEKIDLDLPELYFFYQYKSPGNAGSFLILKSETGSPLLAEQRFGDGRFMISAIGTDPGWSNFPVNPLFAPLYYRSVLYAASSEQGGVEEHVLGHPFEWKGELGTRSVELQKGQDIIKPDVKGMPDGIHITYKGREWKPGILKITGGTEERRVAVNQDIMESDFHTLKNKQLENVLGNSLTISNVIDASELSGDKLHEQLEASGFGEEIWSWFIWGALLFLIAETVIARLYKAESVA